MEAGSSFLFSRASSTFSRGSRRVSRSRPSSLPAVAPDEETAGARSSEEAPGAGAGPADRSCGSSSNTILILTEEIHCTNRVSVFKWLARTEFEDAPPRKTSS